MADIVPTAASLTGLPANRGSVWVDPPGALPSAGSKSYPVSSLIQRTFYFADVDTAELFIPPRGTLAAAWQPLGTAAQVAANITATGILFTADTAVNSTGWLHCLDRGTQSVGTTTSEAPVSKGTAGWVEPQRSMFLNHKSATPNTLSLGRKAAKLGLKLRVFAFSITTASDRWTNQSASLCPGIQAVAWQADDTTADNQVATTLDAAGDTIFTSAGGGTGAGWLWAWSR